MAESTDLQRLIVRVEAQLTRFDKEMRRASGVADRAARSVEQRFRRMDAHLGGIGRSAARSLIAPLAGIGAALTVREVLQYADAWTRAQNTLKVSGVTGEQLAGTMQRLFEIAQRQGAALEPLVTLYGRLRQSGAELGASSAEIEQFTEGVAAALRVQGGDAASASGALLQLSQAMGSAVVRAEEFNSINEGARPILQAVANGLDAAGGSVSRLRALVLAGKVTSRDFFQAFLRGADDLKAQAAGASTTIEQGMTRVRNAFTKFIGETDNSLSASQRLVAGLNALADNFDTVADVGTKLAAILGGALLGRAIVGVATTVGIAGAALLRLVGILKTASAASITFRAALGPIGLVLGAVAAGLYLLASRQSEAEAAAAAHAEALNALAGEVAGAKGQSKEYIEGLIKEKEAMLQAAEAALTLAEAKAAAEQQDAISRKLQPHFSMGVGTQAPRVDPGAVLGEAIGANIGSQLSGQGPAFPFASEEAQTAIQQTREKIDALRQAIVDLRETPAGTGNLPPPLDTDGKGKLNEYQRAIAAIKERTEALRMEAGVVGLSAEQAEKARAAFDLLNAAQEAGRTITPELRAEIEQLAGAFATAQVELDKTTAEYQRMKDITAEIGDIGRSALRSVVDVFKDGKVEASEFADILSNIADRLLDMVFSSQGGSLLNALFGLGGGGGVGAPLNLLPGRARGGGVGAGQPYIVGERGPELFLPGRAGYVVPNLAGLRSGGAATINLSTTIDARGSTLGPADMKALLDQRDQQIRAELPRLMQRARQDRRV